MASHFLSQCRTFLERQQLLQQQQQKRLARRIHDIVSQKLTLLSLQLSVAGIDSKPPADWAQNCRAWSASTIELGHALRDVINDLKPRVLEETGLVPALQWIANSLPETFIYRVIAPPQPLRLPPPFANEIFSICRDVFIGLLAPSGVSEAIVQVEAGEGTIRVHIRPGPVASGRELTPESLNSWFIPERMMYIGGKAELIFDNQKPPVITLSIEAAAGENVASAEEKHSLAAA